MEYLLSLVLIVACPIMMGLMLWLMPRISTSRAGDSPERHVASRPTADASQGDQLAGRSQQRPGLCLNWKVLVGLAVAGLGIWIVAPSLVGAVLPLLLLAACPLSMLLMMWGMGGDRCAVQPASARPAQGSALSTDERLARLKAEQAALARDIAQGEAARDLAEREAGVATPADVTPGPVGTRQPVGPDAS